MVVSVSVPSLGITGSEDSAVSTGNGLVSSYKSLVRGLDWLVSNNVIFLSPLDDFILYGHKGSSFIAKSTS